MTTREGSSFGVTLPCIWKDRKIIPHFSSPPKKDPIFSLPSNFISTAKIDFFVFFAFSGTRVFQVQATDDDKTGPNAQITYSIVSQGNKFNIDPNEGWLTTNAVSFY